MDDFRWIALRESAINQVGDPRALSRAILSESLSNEQKDELKAIVDTLKGSIYGIIVSSIIWKELKR